MFAMPAEYMLLFDIEFPATSLSEQIRVRDHHLHGNKQVKKNA